MEEVQGIPGSLPILVPYPSRQIQARVPPAEWQKCLDSWIFCIQFRLRLRPEHFQRLKLSQSESGVPFLLSFLPEASMRSDPANPKSKSAVLHNQSYFLLKRLLLEAGLPYECSARVLFDLLACGCVAFSSLQDWHLALSVAWERSSLEIIAAVKSFKLRMLSDLNALADMQSNISRLEHANALIKALPATGLIFMTGSDYLETLVTTYDSLQSQAETSQLRKGLTAHLFYCIISVLSTHGQPVFSVLDALYHIKSEADRTQKAAPSNSTLLSSLVCTTSFLRHFQTNSAVLDSLRGRDFVETLQNYRQDQLHLHPPSPKKLSRQKKGKAKADPTEEMHMHKMSQLSQIHELFPSIGQSHIFKLLDHFNNDVEAVIAGLLEPDSLPQDLRGQGSEYGESRVVAQGAAHDLAPGPTPALHSSRRNVFDGDDFDNLRISKSKIHKGRRDITAEHETAEGHSRSKAAILAALAAFDSDDDERDDTYDVADVGGTVDDTVDTDSRPRQSKLEPADAIEGLLFQAWKDNQGSFARDSKTRMSKVRQEMKRETGMGDEQIEGWAIMLQKDSALEVRLERKYVAAGAFRGNQKGLAPSKWRADASGTDSHDDDVDDNGKAGPRDGRRVGQAQIRGGRTWGRGRGGSTAGPASEASTQAARKRKEQGRGRGGASHHRRESRAKKIGRGMAGPTGS